MRKVFKKSTTHICSRPLQKTVESAKMEEQIRLIGLVVRIFPSKIARLRFSLHRLPIYYDFCLVLFPINKSCLKSFRRGGAKLKIAFEANLEYVCVYFLFLWFVEGSNPRENIKECNFCFVNCATQSEWRNASSKEFICITERVCHRVVRWFNVKV